MSTDHPFVRVDPRIAFGHPMVGGTPVGAVGGMLIAGEPLDVVADEYNLGRPEILVACWYLAAHEPRWQAWRAWAVRVHPLLAARMPVDYDAVPDPPLDLVPERQPDLSVREEQVLRGIAAGLTNAAIGRQLHIHPETVRSHLRRLLAKLGARNRANAVARGYDLGLLGDGR